MAGQQLIGIDALRGACERCDVRAKSLLGMALQVAGTLSSENGRLVAYLSLQHSTEYRAQAAVDVLPGHHVIAFRIERPWRVHASWLT